MFRFKKEWEKALENFNMGLKILEELKVPPVAAYAYTEVGHMYSAKGEPATALTWYEKAVNIYEQLNAPIFVEKLTSAMKKLKR
jgi:tetratricopeptide (TPR) repeat protein